MSEVTHVIEAIRVHLTGSDVPLGQAPAPRRRARRTEYLTVVLDSDDPVQEILPASTDRVCAYVQALDNDIVVGKSAGQVGAAGNTVTSTPRPSGTLIPHTNTTPWKVEDSGKVWAGVTTTASASRVSIMAVYEV